MIDVKEFVLGLESKGLRFYTGVPDSLLSGLCAYLAENVPPQCHFAAANEGNAVALAIGYYLATGMVPVVYMQNSGLGNSVNPLLSLADQKVYSIPMLLLVGWRGEPGVKDEPQHVKQGEVTLSLLKSMGVESEVLDATSDFAAVLERAAQNLRTRECPYAIVVRKGTFPNADKWKSNAVESGISREAVIAEIIECLALDDLVISNTGKASRELFECRTRRGEGHAKDFLTVGGMGHTSQIALAVAAWSPGRRIVCIDGDGGTLMHMGALATSGALRPRNFKHFVLNNGCHESVGGQPTAAPEIRLSKIAEACGYPYAATVHPCTEADVAAGVREALNADGAAFVEFLVTVSSRSNLGRPTVSPYENSREFMKSARP